MKALHRLSIIPLLVALSVSCSDSNEPDIVTIADFAGTWTASRFEITDPSGTVLSESVDLIGDAFGSLVITVVSNGSFTGMFKPSVVSESMSVAGTISLAGSTLTIAFSDGLDAAIAGAFELDGDQLVVHGTNLTFDYDDQTITGASVLLVMNR